MLLVEQAVFGAALTARWAGAVLAFYSMAAWAPLIYWQQAAEVRR